MWGAARYFRRVGGVPFGMALASVFTVAAFLWLAVRLVTGGLSSWWGAAIAIELAAACLFWWAVRATATHRLSLAFSDNPPSMLLASGPYRYVRHPFYTSYLVFWTAAAADVVGVSHWLIPLAALALYTSAALYEERKFARSPLSGSYVAYRASTGMFLPRLAGLAAVAR